MCGQITPLAHRSKVYILQHPNEAKHPKNTAALASLGLQSCEIHRGELADDFTKLRAALAQSKQPTLLIYPSETSAVLESAVPITAGPRINLLFIDATWKKAYRLYQQNPWLQSLPCYRFDNAPVGEYRIRATRKVSALSTLEAVAYALELTDNLSAAPLRELLNQWVTRKLLALPDAVRQRYDK